MVDGSVTGGLGADSGTIRTDAGLNSLIIGGSLAGGLNERSGSIYADGMLRSVVVGSILGGYAPNAASIVSGTPIGSVTVRQDASGADFSVLIAAPGIVADNLAIGRVSI